MQSGREAKSELCVQRTDWSSDNSLILSTATKSCSFLILRVSDPFRQPGVWLNARLIIIIITEPVLERHHHSTCVTSVLAWSETSLPNDTFLDSYASTRSKQTNTNPETQLCVDILSASCLVDGTDSMDVDASARSSLFLSPCSCAVPLPFRTMCVGPA